MNSIRKRKEFVDFTKLVASITNPTRRIFHIEYIALLRKRIKATMGELDFVAINPPTLHLHHTHIMSLLDRIPYFQTLQVVQYFNRWADKKVSVPSTKTGGIGWKRY